MQGAEEEKPGQEKQPQGNPDTISQAAKEFKAALEKLGYTDVVLLYSYTHGKKCYLGQEFSNYLTAVGVAEQIKIDLLHNL